MQHALSPVITLLSKTEQLETKYMAEYINRHS